MDAWLGSGLEPSDVERRSILSLSNCSIVTTSAEGALTSRTALVERVGPSGAMVTIRLLGSGLYDDIIPNPRVLVMARPGIGPHELVAINGLARIQSRTVTGGPLELLLLDVAIQRVQCWGSAPAAAPRPLMPLVEERPAAWQEAAMALRHA